MQHRPSVRQPSSEDHAPAARRGRRPAFSLEQIVGAAVDLLDEGGVPALTFRTLAGRLGAGVGSLYWYVASKEELLNRATDAVVETTLDPELVLPTDPFDALRFLANALYDAMQQHPWAGDYLMRDTELQPAAMRYYDDLGRQLQRLDLTTRQRFHAISALIGFVVGVGAERGDPPTEVLEEGVTQEEALRRYAERWRSLDANDFPFIHEVADEFERHQDVEQFRAGLELILSGIRTELNG